MKKGGKERRREGGEGGKGGRKECTRTEKEGWKKILNEDSGKT